MSASRFFESATWTQCSRGSRSQCVSGPRVSGVVFSYSPNQYCHKLRAMMFCPRRSVLRLGFRVLGFGASVMPCVLNWWRLVVSFLCIEHWILHLAAVLFSLVSMCQCYDGRDLHNVPRPSIYPLLDPKYPFIPLFEGTRRVLVHPQASCSLTPKP